MRTATLAMCALFFMACGGNPSGGNDGGGGGGGSGGNDGGSGGGGGGGTGGGGGGGTGGGGGGGAGGGGGGGTPTGKPGVVCGMSAATCAANEFCCLPLPIGGATDKCASTNGGACVAEMHCDGPEDCTGAGQVCCSDSIDNPRGSSCAAAADCNVRGKTPMCHDIGKASSTDCGAGSLCCPYPLGGAGHAAYGLCFKGTACPAP